MNSIDRRRVRGPVVPALVLIGLGVVFLLTENHIIHSYDLWKLWPFILIVAGLGQIYTHPRQRRFEGWLLVAAGLLFLASSFGYLHISAFEVWPIALIAAGFILLWRAIGPGHKESMEQTQADAENFVIFGGAEFNLGDLEFQGTAVTVVFGGYNLDLRKAVMKGSSAYVDATAIFGGIELRVPMSWNVVVQGFPMFGGYSDETLHPEGGSNAPQLLIKGSAVFGGVNIKN
jgi:predicted membrane protein